MTWHPDIPLEYRNQIVTGDARELAKLIPDESIDLIFTDPVYDRIEDYEWLAETAARVLKPDKALLTFYGIGWTEETYAALRKGGRPVSWMLPVLQIGQTQRIHPKVFNHWYGLLWAGGEPRRTFADVTNSAAARLSGNHRWRKSESPLTKRLLDFTDAHDVVLDLFTGGGSIVAVCKYTIRNYIAFEIDPETADLARERVLNTQPPLFVPEPEQLDMI